jgi:hypothetical protein
MFSEGAIVPEIACLYGTDCPYIKRFRTLIIVSTHQHGWPGWRCMNVTGEDSGVREPLGAVGSPAYCCNSLCCRAIIKETIIHFQRLFEYNVVCSMSSRQQICRWIERTQSCQLS